MADSSDVDFFGAHIKVKSPRLAALLNSAVTDNVVVVGKRALDLVSSDEREEDLNVVLDGGPAAARGDDASVEETVDRLVRRPPTEIRRD